VPRALQAVNVSFGLVTIPVKLYGATEAKGGIHFNLLHQCGSRVRQVYRCVTEDKEVPRDELIKGFEVSKDQFVTFSKEELDALDEQASGMVEITEFVPAETIDPVYYEKTYYLGPDKGGAKPYRLLAEAMRRAGRSAIGRWAARGKQYLVTLRVVDHGLVMQTLLYADEVRPIADIEVPEAKVADKELALAAQLIDSITGDRFDPTQYKDEVKERIEAQIQKKVEGQQITAPEAPVAPGGAQVIDIMEALRASLRSGAAAPRRAPAKQAAKATPERERPAAREDDGETVRRAHTPSGKQSDQQADKPADTARAVKKSPAGKKARKAA